jgi:hypothetical protein
MSIATKNVDTITINSLPYPQSGGFLPAPVSDKILRTNGLTVAWGDVNPNNMVSGSVSDVLKTVAPGTVAWDTLKPADIAPGTSLQVMHTKLDGSAAEWTSNLDLPANFSVTGTSILSSNVSCGQNLNINGDLQFNLSSGTNGQYLKKTGATTQAWQTLSVSPTVITPGTANQLLVTNIIGTAAIWSSNPIVPGSLNLLGDLQLNSVSGISGQFLKKTGVATQAFATLTAADIPPGTNNQALFTRSGVAQFSNVIPSDITTGSANQFLVKDITGAATIFTSNPICPGNFTVNGITNIIGDFQLNSVSGNAGDYLQKTGPTTQTWQPLSVDPSVIVAGSDYDVLTSQSGAAQWIQPLQIRKIICGALMKGQDIATVSPTDVSFNSPEFINIATSNTSPVNGITFDGTSFVFGDDGYYSTTITGLIRIGSSGLGNTVAILTIAIDGVEQDIGCATCSGDYSFNATIPPIFIGKGQKLTVVSQVIVGGGNLITYDPASGTPKCSSTVVVTLVQ